MASTDQLPPSSSPGVPALPPIPSPAHAPPPSPVTDVRASGLDWLLLGLVAALALLLASFPERDSGLWRHLAAGRLLTHGEQLGATFGADRTWLFDLAAYLVHSALGGVGLVLVKALLVVVLALVLFRQSRSGRGWALAAACTALALLAMSTRLLVQPATVSCLLLALALWVLRERDGEVARRAPPLLPPWPLLVLFVIWANLDSWFVLGLGTVALVWLGRAVDEAAAAEGDVSLPVALLRRGCSLALLAAACLLNPSHVHAFALPAELNSSVFSLASGAARSPFQRAYFAHFGLTSAVLAYFPLLVLGLLSFLLVLPRLRWGRLLPWLGLAVLSAFQAKTIPFFAVVAGPVLALNLQDALARLAETRHRAGLDGELNFRGGRVLTVVLGVVLIVCAWPGWLQAPPFEPRRWAVEPVPALESAAAAVRGWQQEGKMGPDARGLYLWPESAPAFAWFCPQDRLVLDDDLAGPIRGDRFNASGDRTVPHDWAERMRAADIDHVIVYDPDRDRLFDVLGRLLSSPEEWPLLHLEGDLAIFGWRDPAAGATDRFRGREVDQNRLAFGPAGIKRAPESQGGAAVRRWWEVLWKPSPPYTIDHGEGTLLLMEAEALRRGAPVRHLVTWDASQSAALLGAAAGWEGPAGLFDAQARLVRLRPRLPAPGSGVEGLPIPDKLALGQQKAFTRQRDDAPPALLYLALRAARRAVAANPEDAKAHLVLGECYRRLLISTRERVWGESLIELAQLRRAQASAALNRAIFLKPDYAQAHLSLGGLYQEMGYLDLTLHHLRTYLKLAQAAGRPAGVSAEEYREQETQFQDELNLLARQVEDAENSYATGSAGMKVLDRAQLAMRKGLAAKARDMLLESDVAAFGPDGMKLELSLLLGTGRVDKVVEWTGPEQEAQLGPAAATPYHWMRARALAASGEYHDARQECQLMGRSVLAGESGQEAVRPRDVIALMIGQAVLDEQPGARIRGLPAPSDVRRAEFNKRIVSLTRALKQEADVTVLRGLLALEEGDVEEAAVAFRVALKLWGDEAAAASGAGLDFNGRPVAQECLGWLGD